MKAVHTIYIDHESARTGENMLRIQLVGCGRTPMSDTHLCETSRLIWWMTMNGQWIELNGQRPNKLWIKGERKLMNDQWKMNGLWTNKRLKK